MSELNKAVIVVPTIREECIRDFLKEWQFPEWARVLVIEDHPEPTFALGDYPNVTHLSHADIEKDLGTEAWIIPRQTDCVRSYGFWKAWKLKPDMIVTLDDDCYPYAPFDSIPPADRLLSRHWERLQTGGDETAWANTLSGLTPRGIPYQNLRRKLVGMLNHGLWHNVPDLDALTQLTRSRQWDSSGQLVEKDYLKSFTVPRGAFFPMCGMNLAFRPEAVSALYFLLMGPAYPYDRFGDIWAGIIFKRICDHLGYAITSGVPVVEHKRASNVWANLRKEAPALEVNERVWAVVDEARLYSDGMGACYRDVADALGYFLGTTDEYWVQLRRAMHIWASLFDGVVQ